MIGNSYARSQLWSFTINSDQTNCKLRERQRQRQRQRNRDRERGNYEVLFIKTRTSIRCKQLFIRNSSGFTCK